MNTEYETKLIKRKVLGKGNALLTFSCAPIAQNAVPGQFVNVSCKNFLKRPFGICMTDPAAGTFSIGVREVGSGTKDILSAEVGDKFSVLGPLGNGFDFKTASKIIAIGGGTGIFPLYFALTKAKELGIETICVNGFRSREDAFFLEECSETAGKMLVSTDSGNYGVKGTVLTALEQLSTDDIEDAAVFVVGPEIMMKKVSEWAAKQHLPCQVSMEKKMACGIGICLVCVCKVKTEEEGKEFHHVRCCKEGPVMDASEVIW